MLAQPNLNQNYGGAALLGEGIHQGVQNGVKNFLDMLNQAYHYNTLMNTAKPYLDQWHKALNAVRANPNDPTAYRSIQVLTGEEDPDKALALATNEYAKLRQQYDQHSKNFAPLNQQLSSRGITPDLYSDEAKFLQFRNQRTFQPHTAGQMPGARMRSPSMSRGGYR